MLGFFLVDLFPYFLPSQTLTDNTFGLGTTPAPTKVDCLQLNQECPKWPLSRWGPRKTSPGGLGVGLPETNSNKKKPTNHDQITWGVRLPETNSKFAPENGWLEYDCFLLGWPIFRGELLVLGRVGYLFFPSFLLGNNLQLASLKLTAKAPEICWQRETMRFPFGASGANCC